MKRLVLGVIGHVDHGKTALVRALTGQDTDRLAEEKQRGISIALGFAHFEPEPGTVIDLIDMPGHERFVRTMISGATGIDAVLLVVAANEGIQPQTIEHVDIAALLGLRRAVVAISKADLVTPDQARQIADDTVRLLTGRGLHALPPVMTSVLKDEGITELRQPLATLAAEQRPRPADGLAYLPIDRAFAMTGHGPVVTGTLHGAAVTAGDMLDLLPLRRRVRVRTVQVHGARVEAAMPGQRVALNLRNVEIGELRRGMALAAPQTLAPSQWLTIAIRAVQGAPPLRNGMRLRALLGTDEVDARLRLLDRDLLEPGAAGFAQLHLGEPVALPAGEHIVLRLVSPPRTVAGGKLLEPESQRRRRNAPRLLQRLERLHSLPPPAIIAAEVQQAGAAGTTIQHLSRLTALAPARVAELLKPLPVEVTRSGLVVTKAAVDKLLVTIPALLAPHPEGLPLPELRGVSAAVLDEVIGRLLARGIICKRGSRLMIPRPDLDRARAQDEAEVAARIAETLRAARLAPPKPDELVPDPPSRRAVDRLLRDGVIVRAVDRAKGKEILFHRDAIDEAKRSLAPLLAAEPGLLVTEIGAALGISRKYSMPLVDHLDTIRFTRRIGDRRILYAPAISGHEPHSAPEGSTTDTHETSQEQL